MRILKRKPNYDNVAGGNGTASITLGSSCGPAQSSVVWDTMVSSQKRACVNQLKQSPVEKLTILHEQQSYFSGLSEEDLIFESDTLMVSVEIGHGSVLIRHPNSVAREEESEASSLSVDTKNEAYSRFTNTTLPVYNANKGGNFSSRPKKPINQDHLNRDDDEKLHIPMNHSSLLYNIDLSDIINFE
ncbi:putative GATA transcription factor [Helianthus annuus]|nr:putative GATA transcription factor [Helianthus annuus]